MTIHSRMFDVYVDKYDKPLIWYGVWAGHYDLRMAGYHVWDKDGSWVGVYCAHCGHAFRAFVRSASTIVACALPEGVEEAGELICDRVSLV